MIAFRLLVGSFDGLLSCTLDEPESAADLPVEPESAEVKLTLLVGTLEVQDTVGDFMQPPMTPAFLVVVLGGSHSFRRRRLSCPSLPAEPTEGAESTEGAANRPRPDRDLRRSGVAARPISLPTRSDDASSIRPTNRASASVQLAMFLKGGQTGCPDTARECVSQLTDHLGVLSRFLIKQGTLAARQPPPSRAAGGLQGGLGLGLGRGSG